MFYYSSIFSPPSYLQNIWFMEWKMGWCFFKSGFKLHSFSFFRKMQSVVFKLRRQKDTLFLDIYRDFSHMNNSKGAHLRCFKCSLWLFLRGIVNCFQEKLKEKLMKWWKTWLKFLREEDKTTQYQNWTLYFCFFFDHPMQNVGSLNPHCLQKCGV